VSGEKEFRGQVKQSRQALHSLFGTGAAAVDGAALPELQPLPVTGPGFYDMTAADYHADPCPEPSLSASMACALVTTTPAHARLKHPRLNPQMVEEEAEHFDVGEVVHAAFLEGRDVVKILDHPDYKTKAAREARDRARADGFVPLLRKRWNEIERMLDATTAQLQAHEEGVDMFRHGLAEPVMVWQEDGLWFRSRLDWLRVSSPRRFAIDDFKTTSTSADPEQLSERTVWNNGWDVKASFYRRGIYELTGFPAEFRFAVQECFEPFALSVVAPSPGAEMLGDMKVHLAIERWRRGLLENDWHAYPKRTAFFEVPAWLEKRWADREVRDGV
jgi:hypothetical protein